MYKTWIKHAGLKRLLVIIVLAVIFFGAYTCSAENMDNERGKKMKIAIITAMQSEFDAVHSLYDFKGDNKEATAEAYGKEILLLKSGMGKVNAALTTQKAIDKGADLVINTGLAGGIDSSLTQGDIVLAEKTGYHDVFCGEGNIKGQVQDLPLYYSASPLVEKLHQQLPEFHKGLTVTGDQFVTDINHLKTIKQDFPEALAVDMESSAVAQTCYLANIPYISLRIISDVVGKENQSDQYNNFWATVPNKAAEMVDNVLKGI